MMDAAGTVLTRQLVRVWGGDGPSTNGCGVTVHKTVTGKIMRLERSEGRAK